MADPISTAITAVQATLRVISEIAKRMRDAELSDRLQDAYDRLADLRREAFNLQDENRRLTQENQELRAKRVREDEMEFDGLVWWRKISGQKTGPFCPTCWTESNHERLHNLLHKGGGAYYCTIHRERFGGGSQLMIAHGKPIFDPNEIP